MKTLYLISGLCLLTLFSGFAYADHITFGPISVGVLLAKASRYNDNQVSVTGYCVRQESLILYGDESKAKRGLLRDAIFIGLTKREAAKLGVQPFTASYVRVDGLFQHVSPETRRVPLPDGDGLYRTLVIGTAGFGPSGVFPNQIINITTFKKLTKTNH